MAITKVLPVKDKTGKYKKSQERVIHDDGKVELRCYSPNNPHWYVNPLGDVNPIVVDYLEDKLSNQGDSSIRSKNIRSVGVIKGDPSKDGYDGYKFLGIRPDEVQDGSQQLEFSIVDAILDGKKKKIDLSKNIKVNDTTTDLGDVLIQSTRQHTRQIYRAKNLKNDFKITYELNLEGLKVRNDKKLRKEKLRTPEFKVTNYGVLSKDNYHKWDTDRKKNEREKNVVMFGMPDFKYFAVPDETIWDPVNWNIYTDLIPKDAILDKITTGGCAAYPFDGKFIIHVKNSNLDHYDMANKFKDSLEKLVGTCDSFIQSRHWYHTFYLDGKIIGVSAYNPKTKTFILTIPTQDLTHYASIFKNTDYISLDGKLDYSYQELYNHFSTDFLGSFNVDPIELDGEYFVPDSSGDFIIENNGGEVLFRIEKPKLLDKDFNIINSKRVNQLNDPDPDVGSFERTINVDSFHTLRKLDDTRYEYIKYSGFLSAYYDILKDCEYIDADTYYGSTADGTLAVSDVMWCGDNAGASETPTKVTNAGSDTSALFIDSNHATNKIDIWTYWITRSYFFFDTSGISGVVDSASLVLRWATNHNLTPYVNLGTFSSPLTTGDWTSFSTSYGNMTYSALPTTYTRVITPADINTSGYTNFIVRDATYDHADSEPFDEVAHRTGFYFADNSGTTYDPYLSIEESATGWTNIAKVNGIASASIAKVNGIVVANIAKVNGVTV